jgi:hypothetical protein
MDEVEATVFASRVPDRAHLEQLLDKLVQQVTRGLDEKALFTGGMIATMTQLLGYDSDVNVRIFCILHLCTCFSASLLRGCRVSARLTATLAFAHTELAQMIQSAVKGKPGLLQLDAQTGIHRHVALVRAFWYSL